jgi:hypothetical protein
VFFKKGSKYKNQKCIVDGHKFDSKAEAAHYQTCLKPKVVRGDILNLELQPRIKCIVDGVKICTYIADFKYIKKECQTTIVEDVKGYKTPVYKLKKKLVEALHPNIEIIEINPTHYRRTKLLTDVVNT